MKDVLRVLAFVFIPMLIAFAIIVYQGWPQKSFVIDTQALANAISMAEPNDVIIIEDGGRIYISDCTFVLSDDPNKDAIIF